MARRRFGKEVTIKYEIKSKLRLLNQFIRSPDSSQRLYQIKDLSMRFCHQAHPAKWPGPSPDDSGLVRAGSRKISHLLGLGQEMCWPSNVSVFNKTDP
ncbi:hypothetical protein BHYA_0029g00100 [Botrytis hyacinthi]|uniref:Uncharacterized protein n=1 Tax=Botrytis hyacinthi TaxID=278943 RepID=A0A4Z1H070_9HELO|nr:hypothetical protein BHYA_0029g00100 [Botrytis hyacinthi]